MAARSIASLTIAFGLAPEGGAQVIDLIEALRASLEKKAPAPEKAAKAQPETRKPPKRAPAAKPATRKTANL